MDGILHKKRVGELLGLAILYANPPVFFERLYRVEWYRKMMEAWVDWIGVQSGQTMLEVGCGPGLLTLHCLNTGIKAHGLDRSKAMLRRARRLEQVAGFKYSFERGDGVALPYKDDIFDTTLAASLINIVSNPRKIVGEMVRVTKLAGRVSYLVPTTAMTSAAASTFISMYRLQGWSAAMLSLWARSAPKMTETQARRVSENTGLVQVQVLGLLDGMVCVVMGVKQAA